jgi:glycosyltransferase involved in cell wall biosynthesis
MDFPVISVVIPVYRSEESLYELSERLCKTLDGLVSSYEIIFVEDSSPDKSWEVIKKISSLDSRFVGLKLSRNFGQHSAISAGLKKSNGQWVVVMDCDLQDQPEEIAKLYHRALEGFDQVVAIRKNRQDKLLKIFQSRVFAKILSYLSGDRINPAVGNFGIYKRDVIDNLNSFKEQGLTFGLMAKWVGFSRDEIEVLHSPRLYGKTTYSFRALIRLGFGSILSHSDRLLKINVKIGFSLSIFSTLVGIWILFRYLFVGESAVGWPSLMVFMTFTTGIILASIGIVGLYIGRIFEEVKERPKFIIWEDTTKFPNKRQNLEN